MVDSGAPHDVIALAGHCVGSAGDVDPELARHQQHERGALVVGGPFGALVTGRVREPLDLDVVRRADALRRVDEVSDKPTARLGRVLVGVSCRPTGVAH